MAPSSSSSSSDSDRDESLDEDLEAFRRALMISGAGTASASGDVAQDDSLDADSEFAPESSGSDDLDLLRSLQDRFSGGGAVADPLSVVQPNPPTDSDDEDDLETLRAIQRRFAQYDFDLKKKDEGDDQDIGIGGMVHRNFGSLESEESRNVAARPLVYSQFPKPAERFVDALKMNRSCQKFIRRKLMEIEAKIEENETLKQNIKLLMDFQLGCKRKVNEILCQKKDPRVRLVSMRKTRMLNSKKKQWNKTPALCYGPTENSHVAKYKMVMRRFAVSLHKRPWSNMEKESLAKGLKQQYQEMLVLNSISLESNSEHPTDSNSMLVLSSSDLDVTPEKIRSFLPLVDWDRLASMYLHHRSGEECEARWLNCEDLTINNSPWSTLEEKRLLFIIQERGVYNWIDIAITLGTCRTPFQCLARYQRSLNPHILKKDWTSDEDAELRAAVEAFGDNNWQLVASHLEGRTGPQCSNRWRKSLHPDRRRVGRWSVDEDRRLKVAVLLFGAKNWNKIAHFAPGRTQVQCRERWLNCLDPSLNLEAWTEEEDAKLLAAIEKHGYSWSKVAACIPPRTDSQCRRRWKVLLPHEVPLLRAARQVKKSVLISNFVDRESERPLIGPNDFSQLVNLPSAGYKTNRSTIMKEASDKLPKNPRAKVRKSKPRAEARKSVERDSTVNYMENSCGENYTDFSLGTYEDANLVDIGRIKRSNALTKSCWENMSGCGMINQLAENVHGDLSPVFCECPDAVETGGNRTRKNRISSSKRDQKPRVESREYCRQSRIQSPVDLSHLPSYPAEIRSIKKRNGKTSRNDQPKKSSAKYRKVFADNVSMVNSNAGIGGIDLSIGPGNNSSTDTVDRVTRKRKQSSDGQQIKCSKKSCSRNGGSFEDDVDDNMMDYPAAASCNPLEVLNVLEMSSLAVEASRGKRMNSDHSSNVTEPICSKKHRAKTRRFPRGNLLTDDTTTDGVTLSEGRQRSCRRASRRVISDPSSDISEAVPLLECTVTNVMDSNGPSADRRPKTLDASQANDANGKMFEESARAMHVHDTLPEAGSRINEMGNNVGDSFLTSKGMNLFATD